MSSFRNVLLASTILSGLAGTAIKAVAGDATVKASAGYARSVYALPAVDGINSTFEIFGGTMARKGVGGAGGTLSIPVSHSYGFQIDAVASRYQGKFMGGLGGHLFWRDPSIGLLGLYVAHTRADFSGAHINHAAVEFEAYRGRWTLQGILGSESGNSGTVGGFTFDIKNRFFDKVNLNYYLTDNSMVTVGHRYVGGKHALALGAEWALPQNSRVLPSLFVEGRIGEVDYRALWAGIRIYNGQKDKSLIRRNREDDPINWIPETLFGLLNNAGGATPPTDVCAGRGFPGWFLDGGECVPD